MSHRWGPLLTIAAFKNVLREKYGDDLTVFTNQIDKSFEPNEKGLQIDSLTRGITNGLDGILETLRNEHRSSSKQPSVARTPETLFGEGSSSSSRKGPDSPEEELPQSPRKE